MNTFKKRNVLIALSFMICSLAIMQGASMKILKSSDTNIQQVAGAATYVAATTEGGTQGAAAAVAGIAASAAGSCFNMAVSTAPVSTTTPPGWVLWGATAVCAL